MIAIMHWLMKLWSLLVFSSVAIAWLSLAAWLSHNMCVNWNKHKLAANVWMAFQGVDTYILPIEVFAIRIKNFDQWKSSWMTWYFISKALDRVIFTCSKDKSVATKWVDWLILAAPHLSWSLEKEHWLLDCILGSKCFHRLPINDYQMNKITVCVNAIFDIAIYFHILSGLRVFYMNTFTT